VTGNKAATNPDEGPVDFAGARADALITICDHARATLPAELVEDPALRQIHVVVDVDDDDRLIARLADFGLVLPDGLAELMTCAGMVDVLYCQGRLPLDTAPATYTPNRALRRAVKLRDGGCVHPACALPAHRCQVHHIVPWPKGPTTVWNLAHR